MQKMCFIILKKLFKFCNKTKKKKQMNVKNLQNFKKSRVTELKITACA